MRTDDLILNLPVQLEPIRILAERLVGSDMHAFEGGVELSPREKIGPHAYALTLFNPLAAAAVAGYESIHGLDVPDRYAAVLSSLNGAHAFQFSLFGIPPLMANDPPLLSRSVSQPYDLATANRSWKLEYGVPGNWFHFGSSPWSFEENIGYFLDPNGAIHAVRKDRTVVASWAELPAFLSDELARCEAMYSDYESSIADALQMAKR